ncbi:nucleic acid-binding protein [Streptomyces griseorubiginosus]|uniref:nucleic acid-binding protein n=1 Tax=Streptomyces griseorubiginosus TaxID=67304 RepID=UPI0036F102C6
MAKSKYNYPDELLKAQRELNAVRADLAALFKKLPYSTEPMEAWARPEGYWLKSPVHEASPGSTDMEQQQVAKLRERERDLAAKIVAHGFWNEIPGTERPDARSQLRYALDIGGDEDQQAA